jgi:hypothetical protein
MKTPAQKHGDPLGIGAKQPSLPEIQNSEAWAEILAME